MPRQSYFSPAMFSFLREVEANNNRPWWEENKDRYITLIREPAKEFIADFGPRLQAISEHFVADTRTNGGSLMRPYRDTRFSKRRPGEPSRVPASTPRAARRTSSISTRKRGRRGLSLIHI